MRITVKQLKKVIRKMIKENTQDTLHGSSWAASAEQHEFDEMSPEFYIDQLMKKKYDTGDYDSLDELLVDPGAYEETLITVMENFPEMPEANFEAVWNEAGFVDQT